jgi:hypothetical protein
MKYFFPAAICESQVKKALKCDNRFTIHESEEGIIVDRAPTSITSAEREVQEAVEEWKNLMSVDFRKHASDIKLCMLSQKIKRPKGVPKNLKLIDILNTDLQRRFLLLPSSTPNKKRFDDMMVKYKCTPAEVEGCHEVWRTDVALYLLQQKYPVPLVIIGTNVAKPKNLGKNQKLIDVIKMDKLGRFDTHVDESHNSLTRLSVTKEFCFQKWRDDIYNKWKSSGCGALLKTTSFRQAHPPAALSYLAKRNHTVWEMIVTDPLGRFKNAIDYHFVLNEVKFDRQNLRQRKALPPTLPLLHACEPSRTDEFSPSLPAQHTSPLHASVDSWTGTRNSSTESERVQGFTRYNTHKPPNCHNITPQQSYPNLYPLTYHEYPTSSYSRHVSPTQVHSQGGYGRSKRTQGPRNSSTVISAAYSPPGFEPKYGAPQAFSAVGRPVVSSTPVVTATSAAAIEVLRQLKCYDKGASASSIEIKPPHHLSHHPTLNIDTDFDEYADPSPTMPVILSHAAPSSPTSKSAPQSSNKKVNDICTAMASYIPNILSLDELVATQFEDQDTAPGLLRFLSDTL